MVEIYIKGRRHNRTFHIKSEDDCNIFTNLVYLYDCDEIYETLYCGWGENKTKTEKEHFDQVIINLNHVEAIYFKEIS